MATGRHTSIAKLFKAILVILVSLLYWAALEIVVAFIHEGGHALAALLMGVPLGEIEFSLHGVVPHTTIPIRFATSNFSFFHYAGGFTSGLILIIFYFLFWYRKYQQKPTKLNWWMGAATAAAAGMEIFGGYMEGRFNAAYMQYADFGSGITFPVLYSLAVIGAFLIHRVVFPYSKIPKQPAVFGDIRP